MKARHDWSQARDQFFGLNRRRDPVEVELRRLPHAAKGCAVPGLYRLGCVVDDRLLPRLASLRVGQQSAHVLDDVPFGLESVDSCAMCARDPERVPGAMPTVDTSLQGKPPMRMSTISK